MNQKNNYPNWIEPLLWKDDPHCSLLDPIFTKFHDGALGDEDLAGVLHQEHPEIVRASRIEWALMSLFMGVRRSRDLKFPKGLRDDLGELPPLLNSLTGFPPDLDQAFINEFSSWACTDHTRDGQGLGIVGAFGSGEEQCAVWATLQMFQNHPFKSAADEESLHDPTERTASFFRAAEISKAMDDAIKEDCSADFPRMILQDCLDHEVLVIVGIGDIPMGHSASIQFFNLLEERRMRRRPTVWTTQFKSAELEKRFSPRLGRSIIQRLSKTAKIVNLIKPAPSQSHENVI